MAGNIRIDIREFEEMANRIEAQIGSEQMRMFVVSCAKELAARLLAKVIRRTPVGVYPRNSGKVGGTLRRGWTAGANIRSRNADIAGYVDSIMVSYSGGVYIIEIINPVEYAAYVEYGHRTHGVGWVNGKFMLTTATLEIQADAPRILKRKMRQKLKELFR